MLVVKELHKGYIRRSAHQMYNGCRLIFSHLVSIIFASKKFEQESEFEIKEVPYAFYNTFHMVYPIQRHWLGV